MKSLKKILAAALAVVSALAFGAGGSADGTVPSLYTGDEPWYKDAVEPLVLRDGKRYVPADLFAALESVSCTEPAEGNLLFVNTADGSYISILFRDGSAAVNGVLEEGIGAFRNETAYYVEAEPVCRALGIRTEEWSGEDGQSSLRFLTGESRFTFDELIEIHAADEEGTGNGDPIPEPFDPPESPQKRIYLLCTSPEDEAPYVASETLREYGLAHTVFLWEDADTLEVLAGLALGEYGVATENAEDTAGALVLANERIRALSHRRTRLTVATGDPETDAAIREAGFCPITPDFTVTSTSDLDAVTATLSLLMETEDSISVFLTDCWKSVQMIGILDSLLSASYGWTAANLAD